MKSLHFYITSPENGLITSRPALWGRCGSLIVHACNRLGMRAIKIANIVVMVKKVWTCCWQKMTMKEKNTTRTSIKSNCSVLPNNVRLILESKWLSLWSEHSTTKLHTDASKEELPKLQFFWNLSTANWLWYISLYKQSRNFVLGHYS